MIRIIKNTILFIALLHVFSFEILSQKSNFSELIAKNADKIEQKVIAWRHDIHQNPELGIEVKTKVGMIGTQLF
ncbi:hypothetical protein [Flavihumibacter fluvii]|uniref:hypothetical protein n=1 Tax=Flavihumibacter fluvii TaxID=2838157 RepID=UPI001BDE888F|nr:hypothetical protein [Flavihumibacter fluvii]ULQ53394.1 hypothetical protein KJS93_03560 [Flavihumibacter fluvii]